MNQQRYKDIKKIIISFLSDDIKRMGLNINEVDDKINILESGLIDYFRFIDLLAMIDNELVVEINLNNLDQENFGSLFSLINFIVDEEKNNDFI